SPRCSNGSAWPASARRDCRGLTGAIRTFLCTAPEPSSVGELTVMCWRGLIPSSFVQDLMDTILSPNMPCPSFVSVTAHSVPTSPVTYIPAEGVKALLTCLSTRIRRYVDTGVLARGCCGLATRRLLGAWRKCREVGQKMGLNSSPSCDPTC
ncbi:hypothetical protein C8Q80DRAFT_1291248, partial [Daedaleopsis nitida]